ncbi:MAG TPA: UPF0182 family protein [Pseudomonadales bacterium]|jgi:uncharacterized membrane protein (UPF0182 family)
MYVLLFVALLGCGAWLAHSGSRHHRKVQVWGGAAIVGSAFGLMLLMAFWAEMLWFDSLGYQDRFWTFVWVRLLVPLLGGAAAGLTGLVLTRGAGIYLRRGVAFACAAAGVIWGLASWQPVLLFLNRMETGIVDPLLGLDTGFYLFVLPLLDGVFWLGLFVALISLITVLALREQDGVVMPGPAFAVPKGRLLIPGASLTLTVVLAFGQLLSVLHLLYSKLGVVMGPGWTDVHVRLPALILMGAIFLVAGMLPLFEGFRGFMARLVARWEAIAPVNVVAVVGAWAVIGGAWLLLVVLLPALTQWLVVKPNEITFEKPYIENNIEFTRRGFKLDRVEERQFSADAALGPESLADNRHLISEVRLWDWRALDAVYKQFQEIRLYYEFVDVDIDRYRLGDRYRQVMVAARELAQRNLPEQSRTFVNQRFKYTHGYGYTLAPVSDFTPEGLPNLLVKDIPPVTDQPELEVTRPEIYYGELTIEPVVTNTLEPEFDYPSGDANIYTRYSGTGGVVLSSFWRKFLFGWKFDGTVFLLSSYPTPESRVLFYRQVPERVQRLAPFLVFDEDPYIVAVDGRLKWIVDAYTSSSYYPYSQAFDSEEFFGLSRDEGQARVRTVQRLDGANYVRNSVKAVIDAYDGSVDFYVFDEEDLIIQVWQRALPGLFKPRSEMPASLVAHVRYPQDFLLAQGLIFTRYHMSDPDVFYNQEDVWVRATEKHYHDITPVEPYYVMWELPGSDEAEFVLILPFTPKNRQVLIGWVAALSDGENYGRFIAYKFPKERRVLGPQQVETKIDQDSFLSGQLTLWDQQGSEVIRGNVLAIPIDDSLLYVEPIYLRAETAAYPELRLVAVMQGDNLSYAETLDEALLGLFTGRQLVGETPSRSVKGLAIEARMAFESYLEALGDKRFEAAGEALRRLSQLLERIDAAASVGEGNGP